MTDDLYYVRNTDEPPKYSYIEQHCRSHSSDTCAAAYKALGNPFSEKNFAIAYHDGTDWVTVDYVEGTEAHSKLYPLLQLFIKEK